MTCRGSPEALGDSEPYQHHHIDPLLQQPASTAGMRAEIHAIDQGGLVGPKGPLTYAYLGPSMELLGVSVKCWSLSWGPYVMEILSIILGPYQLDAPCFSKRPHLYLYLHLYLYPLLCGRLKRDPDFDNHIPDNILYKLIQYTTIELM